MTLVRAGRIEWHSHFPDIEGLHPALQLRDSWRYRMRYKVGVGDEMNGNGNGMGKESQATSK
jgi:hypothetical protein